MWQDQTTLDRVDNAIRELQILKQELELNGSLRTALGCAEMVYDYSVRLRNRIRDAIEEE